MSLAVANAICNTRMRAAAALIARGVREDRIEYWSEFGTSTDCGLNVDGVKACLLTMTKTEDLVTIEVWWSETWAPAMREAA